MTTFVTLRIESDYEARDLINDIKRYPNECVLTPVQETTVRATVVSVYGTGRFPHSAGTES